MEEQDSRERLLFLSLKTLHSGDKFERFIIVDAYHRTALTRCTEAAKEFIGAAIGECVHRVEVINGTAAHAAAEVQDSVNL